ncbi:SGNH/GDSL hydrolase family protein [Roseateles cellulosilyticus]|uniref:SGNH/GDSL hydrolase family protein n=1 Tax=Pelomonas cellulosilytica TaxID=2906762 RepID=A0ABS8Y1Z3_9BURK|nr:SGNH/GDSL hydrolase family protein [Pelomonas sp. P8]MCE4558050.1 SGNH/GDSL hydrolase family protein [Pelomonas sp. P8]
MIRRVLTAVFQVFIVVCLVDGFLDIVYPAIGYFKKNMEDSFRAPEMGIKMPRSGLPVRQEPGIPNILKEYASAYINIAPDGRRSNGGAPLVAAGHKGILLGSSTAFGHGVKDSQTISSQLERELEGVRVYNYAGLGQPTSSSILRWYDLQKKYGNPDFVIVAGINYQIYSDCKLYRSGFEHSNIFFHLAKVAENTSEYKHVSQCESSDSADLAVRNSIVSVESALSFGRKMGSPFYLVYLPTPYDPNANIDHLITSESARSFIVGMQKVYAQYRKELKKLDVPELIDLSDALPPEGKYFTDLGGHLSAEGNKIVAKALAQRIRPIVSSPSHANFNAPDGPAPLNN